MSGDWAIDKERGDDSVLRMDKETMIHASPIFTHALIHHEKLVSLCFLPFKELKPRYAGIFLNFKTKTI